MKGIKRFAAVFCSLLIAAAASFTAAADPAQGAAQPEVVVKAKSAILVDAATGKVLYENNAHEKLYPASITKIMTELLVLEALENGKLKWDDKITCSAHASSMGGSDIWLEPGEVMTVTDLFKAMSINSANDAAVALAEKVAGSEPAFVNLMNKKAQELGMKDSHFSNCTGLDADDNYVSAYDVMLMSKALIAHKNIFNYTTIWMDTLRGGKTALYNTNRLIRFYNGANGLKTGSTSKAGYCLSSTALRDNMQLIAVVMDCKTVDDRFSSAGNLLDYGFAKWSTVTPKLKNGSVTVKVLHGEKDTVTAVAEDSPSILMEKGTEGDITQKISCVPNVMAPVVKGQVVGQITFWVGGKNIGSIPLRTKEAIGKLTFPKAFARLFGNMVG